MTPQASSSSSFIQGVLAACGVSIPAADLSELRLVRYPTTQLVENIRRLVRSKYQPSQCR